MTDMRWKTILRAPVLPALLAALLALPACGPDAGAEDEHAEEAAGHTDEHAEGEEHAGGEAGRVTLSEAAFQTAQIRVEPVGAEAVAAGGAGLQVPGQVEFDPARVAMISPRTGGRIERLAVVEGDRVGAGQTVALVSSPQFLTAQNDLLQALRRAELLAGTQDAQGAAALVEAARRRLRLLGVGDAAIQRIAASGEISAVLPVHAPFGGSIVETHALAGEAVEAGTPLFKLADLAVVDVAAEVPEQALPLLSIGQGAQVAIAAYPGMRFRGRVERLRDQLDPTTRTIKAVIHVPNPNRTLRPGMFATVTLDAPAGESTPPSGQSAAGATVLTIPSSALVTDGDARYVFVEAGPRTYERREVVVESLSPPGSAVPLGGRVAVRSGLSAGERVVVNGAFTLKSELGKSGFSHEH